MMIRGGLFKDSDHNSVLKFLALLRKDGQVCGIFHAGDFIWRTYSSQFDFKRNKNIYLWKNTKQDIVCMVWAFPEDGYGEVFIEPHHFNTDVEVEAFDWLESCLAEALQIGERLLVETGGPIVNSPYKVNKMREAGLVKHGFRRGNDIYVQMCLKGTPDPVPVPNGFMIKSVAEGLSIKTLLENRPHHDMEKYKKFNKIEGYDPELDMAVVSDDGRVSSYCIFWYDRYTQSGLLEPVGTLESYRGKGLAKALLNKGVRYLKEKGARDVFVCPVESNKAAVALYKSVGFKIISKDQTWYKELVGS